MGKAWHRPQLVLHASGLKAGDVVEVRGCRLCGRNHQHVLFSLNPSGGWRTAGKFHGGDSLIVGPAIAEGRLWLMPPGTRLADVVFEDAVANGLALIDAREKQMGRERRLPGT